MAISETREQRLAREAAEQIAADAKRKEQEKASYLEIAKKPGMQEYLTKFSNAYKKAFETGDFSGLQTVINEQVNNKGGLFEFGRRDHNGPPTYDTAFEGLLNMATKMGEYGITPPLTKTVQADKYASIYKDIYKKASDRTVSSPLGRLQMELNAVKKYKENEEIVKKSAPPNLNNLNELSGKTFSKLTSGGRVDSITFIPNSLGYKDYYKYQLQGTGEWRFGKQVPSNAVPGTGSYIGRDYSVYYKDEKGETRSMPIDNLSTFGITVNALPKDYIDYTKSTKGNVSSLSNIWNGDIGDVNAAPKKAGPSSYETADGKSIGKFDAGYDQYDKYVKGLEAAGINYKGESISGAPLTPEQQAYLAKNKPAHYGVFINNLGQQVTATSLEMLKNMTALGFPQVSAPTATMNTTQQAELAAVAPGIPRTDLQPIADKLIAAQPKVATPTAPTEQGLTEIRGFSVADLKDPAKLEALANSPSFKHLAGLINNYKGLITNGAKNIQYFQSIVNDPLTSPENKREYQRSINALIQSTSTAERNLTDAIRSSMDQIHRLASQYQEAVAADPNGGVAKRKLTEYNNLVNQLPSYLVPKTTVSIQPATQYGYDISSDGQKMWNKDKTAFIMVGGWIFDAKGNRLWDGNINSDTAPDGLLEDKRQKLISELGFLKPASQMTTDELKNISMGYSPGGGPDFFRIRPQPKTVSGQMSPLKVLSLNHQVTGGTELKLSDGGVVTVDQMGNFISVTRQSPLAAKAEADAYKSTGIAFKPGLDTYQMDSIIKLAAKPASTAWSKTDETDWAYATNNAPIPKAPITSYYGSQQSTQAPAIVQQASVPTTSTTQRSQIDPSKITSAISSLVNNSYDTLNSMFRSKDIEGIKSFLTSVGARPQDVETLSTGMTQNQMINVLNTSSWFNQIKEYPTLLRRSVRPDGTFSENDVNNVLNHVLPVVDKMPSSYKDLFYSTAKSTTQTTQPVNTTTQTNPLVQAITEAVPTNQNPTLASTMTQIAGVTAPTPQTNTGGSSSLLSVDEIKRITATIAKPYESPSLASTLSEIKAPTTKPVAAPQTSYTSSGQSTPITPGEPLKRAIIRSKRVNSINPLAKRGGSPRLKTKLNYA